jgi:hypothetical protein
MSSIVFVISKAFYDNVPEITKILDIIHKICKYKHWKLITQSEVLDFEPNTVYLVEKLGSIPEQRARDHNYKRYNNVNMIYTDEYYEKQHDLTSLKYYNFPTRFETIYINEDVDEDDLPSTLIKCDYLPQKVCEHCGK